MDCAVVPRQASIYNHMRSHMTDHMRSHMTDHMRSHMTDHMRRHNGSHAKSPELGHGHAISGEHAISWVPEVVP